MPLAHQPQYRCAPPVLDHWLDQRDVVPRIVGGETAAALTAAGASVMGCSVNGYMTTC
jgi:hypothetical protein